MFLPWFGNLKMAWVLKTARYVRFSPEERSHISSPLECYHLRNYLAVEWLVILSSATPPNKETGSLGSSVRSALAFGLKGPWFEPPHGLEKRLKNLALNIISCHSSDLVA